MPEPQPTEAPPECAQCHAVLDRDEADSPFYLDEAPVCDICYSAVMLFECCGCGGDGTRVQQHRYLLVQEAGAVGLTLPGLYRVDHPDYQRAPLAYGGTVVPEALTWVGFVPALDADADRAPWGHLCTACQARALATAQQYRWRCAAVAGPRG